jgi:hypothetical protein
LRPFIRGSSFFYRCVCIGLRVQRASLRYAFYLFGGGIKRVDGSHTGIHSLSVVVAQG